jgi:uncharacterized protein involved in exopolysaccharide biosynthesis
MIENTSAQQQDNRVFDEFSPQKLILQIQSTAGYIVSKWKIILLVAFIFGITGYILSSFKNPTYAAEITFALDEGAGQSARSDFAQLSEQLGMGPVLEAGGVFSSMTNIVELIQSRLLIEKTLRSSVKINGKSLVFADFFLDSLNYREKWMEDTSVNKLHLLAAKKTMQDSLFENKIIRNIYDVLTTKNIKVENKGKGTSIISVSCVSENELFSKYFLEALIDKVIAFYIDNKTQRARLDVAFLQHRTDSINQIFTGSLYGKAAFTDANINAVRQVGTVAGERQAADIQIQKTTYADLFRSLEIAKTKLMKETPLIQYIDLPILPLKMNNTGVMKYAVVFFILGAFLTSLWLLMYRVYRHFIPKVEEPDFYETYYPAPTE